MNRTEILILLISVGLTLFFSTIFGFAGRAVIGTFWAWFAITLCVQVIGFALYNSQSTRKEEIERQKVEVLALEQLSKFSVKLKCAYCNHPTVIPIQLNQKNTFKCESCKQINGVAMQFSATTITTPIQSVKVPLGDESEGSFDFQVSR